MANHPANDKFLKFWDGAAYTAPGGDGINGVGMDPFGNEPALALMVYARRQTFNPVPSSVSRKATDAWVVLSTDGTGVGGGSKPIFTFNGGF